MVPKKSGILLYAKKAGFTSFSSLYDIKKSLGTSKVGHTGTLDSFADGLLVVVSGSLTRLVPHITSFDKSYTAVFVFGEETDTLDPTGTVCKTADLPAPEALYNTIPQFTGSILQSPPAFSAVHVNGRRASDIARSGGTVTVPPRTIYIHQLLIDSVFLEDGRVKYALVSVSCSKGTYIRSLARDIAAAVGSCAHVGALRRTAVGPFLLENAAGAVQLPVLSIENFIADKNNNFPVSNEKIDYEEIRQRCVNFTPEISAFCGLPVIILNKESVSSFQNGKKLLPSMFIIPDSGKTDILESEYAVFTEEGVFAGVVLFKNKRFSYQYVIPREE